MAGIFKAYDVRGTELAEEMACTIGLAFPFALDEEDRARSRTVVVSRDMRSHSEPLADALIMGLRDAGLDVLDIGLATTPMNYFTVGRRCGQRHGHPLPAAPGRAGIEPVPLYFELDGTFAHHEANPLKMDNLRDLQAEVRRTRADLGVSFGGDTDRSAFVDERGEPVGSDLSTALIAGELLEREPGKPVVYDLRSSRAVPE